MATNITNQVRTIFSADATGYLATVATMSVKTAQFGSKLGKLATTQSQDWDRVTAGFLKGGAAIAGVLALTGKAAMDWQSDFAGVRKTVDDTDPAFAGLEDSLRGMARTMATSHTEIAAVAEAAGALGVKTKDIAGFTKTMIQLGETTNLSADDAATSLAQLMTIMGTAPEMVGRLGATLVDLGNNGASTEKQIVELSQRLAGAARAVGLNEAQLMGYASAIASTGINAEAGGTAMSRVFTRLDRMVSSSSPKLEAITELMGEDWPQAFREDASGATQAFLEKLGQLQAQGGSVTKVLDQMGIKGVYETDVIRRLAGAGGLLGEQLGIANTAMQQGTALMAEYQKRAETAESKVQVAWNNIKDSAITAGSVMLPMISDAAEGVARLAQSFAGLDPGIQHGVVQFAAIAAGALLFVGVGMKVVSVVSQAVKAYQALAATSPLAAAGIAKVGKAAAAATIALTAMSMVGAHIQSNLDKGMPTVGEYGNMLMDVGKKGELSAGQMQGWADIGKTLAGWDTFGRDWPITNTIAKTITGMLGMKLPAEMAEAEFAKMDQAMQALPLDQTAVGFKQISDQLAATGTSNERMLQLFPTTYAALQQQATNLKVTGLTAEDYVKWMGGEIPFAVRAAAAGIDTSKVALTDQEKALIGVKDEAEATVVALQKLAQASMAAQGDKIAVNKSVDDAITNIGKRGKSTSTTSEKGQDNWTDYLTAAQGVQAYISSLDQAGADEDKLAAAHEKQVEALTKVGKKMGMTGEEARALAEYYAAIPGDVQTDFSAPGAVVTKQQAKDIASAVKAIPSAASTTILAPGARPSKAEVDEFMSTVEGLPKEQETAIRTIAKLGGVTAARVALAGLKDRDLYIKTHVLPSSASVKIDGATYNIKVKGGRAADGGIFGPGMRQFFSAGGFPAIGAQPPQIRPYSGAAGITWSELGSGPWEAFISGHPSKRDRSIDIWERVGRRLGVLAHADGGVVDFNTVRSMAAGLNNGGQGATVNLTSNTYYPQAEPTSVSNRRTLEAAAALGRY